MEGMQGIRNEKGGAADARIETKKNNSIRFLVFRNFSSNLT